MSSWLELEQNHKRQDKLEIKDKLMQLSTKIKTLELSFQDTLETLNNESFLKHRSSFPTSPNVNTFLKQSYKKTSFVGTEDKYIVDLQYNKNYARPIKPIMEIKPICRDIQETYQEYLQESKLKY